MLGGLSGKVAGLDEGVNGRQLSGAQKGLAARPCWPLPVFQIVEDSHWPEVTVWTAEH